MRNIDNQHVRVPTAVEFAQRTGSLGVGRRVSKSLRRSGDLLAAIQAHLDQHHSAGYSKLNLQRRHRQLELIARLCQIYLESLRPGARGTAKARYIEQVRDDCYALPLLETRKAQSYGQLVNQAPRGDHVAIGGPAGTPHFEVKYERAMFGHKRDGPVYNGHDVLEQFAGQIGLTGNDDRDAYKIRQWVKQNRERIEGRINRLEYLDLRNRARYFVEIRQGELLQGGVRLHTGGNRCPPWAHSAPFAMSGNGDLYVALDQREGGTFHHSSFLGGEPVVCAGTLCVWQGRLKWFSDMSGHYQPGWNQLVAMARVLQGRRVAGPVGVIRTDHTRGEQRLRAHFLPSIDYVVEQAGNSGAILAEPLRMVDGDLLVTQPEIIERRGLQFHLGVPAAMANPRAANVLMGQLGARWPMNLQTGELQYQQAGN